MKEGYVGDLGCFRVIFNIVWGLVLLFNKNPGRKSSLLVTKYLMDSQMSSDVLHCKIILRE